jgi:ABC-type phosphate/phosphonate transport system substrate-binding protein
MHPTAANLTSFALLTLSVVTARTAAPPEPAPAAGRTVRLGIAQGMWNGVNPNDARAAIQAWTGSILKQRGNTAKVETRVFAEVERLANALADGEIDGASLQTDRFLALPPALRPTHVFVAARQGSISDRYVILAHAAGGFTNVSQLPGRTMVIHDGARTCLAQPWIENILGGTADSLPQRAPRGVARCENALRTVLQVFFRQFDTAVVTSNAFDLACELNPQIRREVRVLAVSPMIVPNVFFFRTSYTGPEKEQLETAIAELHTTADGRQVLTVFQCDRMVRQPVACLDSTKGVLAEHERLRKTAGEPAPRPPLARAANNASD